MKKSFIIAFILMVGLLGAFALIIGQEVYRFPAVPQYRHADFAIFINGQRLDFSAARYTDPESCKVGIFIVDDENPEANTYLKEGGQVIHVHQKSATYQDFFESIGVSFDGHRFKDDRGNIYEDDTVHEFRVFLNKQEVDSVNDREIQDLDHLLISYGRRDRADADLAYELAEVPDLACFYSVVCPYQVPSVKDLCVPDNYYRTILYYWFGI